MDWKGGYSAPKSLPPPSRDTLLRDPGSYTRIVRKFSMCQLSWLVDKLMADWQPFSQPPSVCKTFAAQESPFKLVIGLLFKPLNFCFFPYCILLLGILCCLV